MWQLQVSSIRPLTEHCSDCKDGLVWSIFVAQFAGSGSEAMMFQRLGLQSCVAQRPWFVAGRIRSSMVQQLQMESVHLLSQSKLESLKVRRFDKDLE